MIAFRRAKRLAQLVCYTEMVMPRNCSGTLEQRREALTKHYYEEECGIDLKDVTLHSFEEMSAETLAAAEEDELVEKWFGHC
jgi:hypothetical protein